MGRFAKTLLLVASDAVLLMCLFISATYLVQFHDNWSTSEWVFILLGMVLLKLVVFTRFGLYHAILRYAGINFLMTVLKSVTLASMLLIIGFYIGQIKIPLKALFVDWLLTVSFMGGSRLLIRYYLEFRLRYKAGRRVLIYGAGDLGVLALRELKHNRNLSYLPVGFIDDNSDKQNKVIHNVRVLGTWSNLDGILRNVSVDEIVVAISEITGERLRKLIRDCRKRNLMCRLIPGFSKVLEMETMVRDLEISDLLRRSPRDLDLEAIDKFIDGKRVLITGSAGSIGSELVRQCMKHNPDEILLIDQSENGLYNLKEEFNYDDRLKYVLADVTSEQSISHIFEINRPHIVFHAAAYKHVPMIENNITQGVINNVEGTRVITKVSDQYKVEKVVLISTDKAVKPSSVMGATKRVCELLVQNLNRKSETEFVAVRFGNVLGSSGSVIPKFIEQIRKNGPVTVTHPETTRYFMLTTEAVQLVLQAASTGDGGKIFILDMGSPVKILEMAEDLIYLMGREPYKDIEITFTGLREGEKIYEELFSEEIDSKTQYENITIAKATLLDWEWFKDKLDILLSEAHAGNHVATLSCLNKLVSNGSFRKGTEKSDLSIHIPQDFSPNIKKLRPSL